MTKRRDPSTVDDAILRIAARIGWDRAAEAVGKGERVVRYWTDPDLGREPTFSEAMALDLAYIRDGGGEPPLLALYQLRLERAVQDRPDQEALVNATSLAAKEVGEALAATIQASQPGAPETVRAIADREVGEACEALLQLRRTLGPNGNVTPIRGDAA